ncbi:hypothetical protein EW146_g2843 [Bondarzewia mesenterica]|uniref:DUF1740-domain-containing protein n=1 Tax=Bondarzewia mesenterica TaxID=1095465 RepID=A0A4S4M0Z9_9AGAM|nr:hypothetical protein EW146_g2843 [Bondarzewia mesenterica]
MNAPSFSSFPPSFGSFPDLEPSSSQPVESSPKRVDDDQKKRKEQERKEKRRKKDKHDDEDFDTGRRGHRYRSKDRSRREDREPFNDERLKDEEDRRRVQAQIASSSSERLSYSDRKGDPLNVRYGGLHSRNIPKYRLVGWGRKILGLNPAFVVVHRSNKGVEVAVGGRRKVPGITDSRARALLKVPPKGRLIPSPESAQKFEEIDGFIKFPSHRQEEQSYRSIELAKDDGDADFESSSDSDLSDSNDEESGALTLTSFQEKTKALEQQLSVDPSSVENWLSLLSHLLSQIPVTSKNATKACSEITVSVLSRALTSLPKSAPSVRVQLKYLQAGEELWPEADLKAEWERALRTNDVEIWHAWLEWRIRKGDGGIDGMVENVLKVLSMSKSDLDRLRVSWRVAIAFHQSGFVERAMALFQAQAELTFRLPASLVNSSLEEQLNALEEFWESEVPRFGEPESKGWAAWVADGCPEHHPDALIHPNLSPGLTNDPDPYRKWAREEILADCAQRTPSRSTDPEADEDPYVTVLFSDVRPFLYALTSARSRTAFRLIWLSFLGLHVPGLETTLNSSTLTENSDDRWYETRLASPHYLASIFPSAVDARRIAAESHNGAIIGPEEHYSSGFGPVKKWGYRVLGPLDVFDAGKWGMWTREDVQGVNQDFVRRIFQQCRLGGDDVEWDVLALAFEAANSVKSALKMSRTFLSTARESLPHWGAHARLERLRGRPDDARKIYETVVSSPSSSQNRLSTGTLWWDWAEMEWLSGKADAALQVTLWSAGVSGTGGGIVILRAKRILEDTVREIPPILWKVREAWLRLGALLELLTASPGAGFPHFLSDPMQAGSVAEESLAVASLSMLYHHIFTLKSTARPTILRERLAQAVGLYPDNTIILGMFLDSQKGQGVWGQVRELVGDGGTGGVVREKSVARRVLDVWVAGWEKGRWEWEIERTRSGLNAAVESERTRGSPTLWRIFVEFEVRARQLKRAKNLLFRAIAQCPGVKELYLLAFESLRIVFTSRELDELAETMAERGLRMRKGLDEAVMGWRDPVENKGVEASSGEEDEIEHNARELRRLKPY